MVLLLLGPAFVFEARLAMPLRGIQGGVPFALPLGHIIVGVLVAVVQGVRLDRAPRDRWLVMGLCASPLLLALPPAMGAHDLPALVERLGEAGTTQLWALLTVAALVAALASSLAARRFVEWFASTKRTAPRPGRAAIAVVLVGAFVVLILSSSTGVDFLSSWVRWGATGVAMVASVLVTVTPGEDHGEPVVHALLFACIGASLLGQREYVAALAAGTLSHVDPFLDPAPYEHSLREIAWAVEPRERYGWVLGGLPFLLLGRWLRDPRRAAVPLALAVLLLGSGYGISRTLDRHAEQGAARFGSEPGPAGDPLLEWSARAVPRSVPWLRAMQGESAARCVAWTP